MSVQTAQGVEGDVEALELVALAHRANREALSTWRGEAVVTTVKWRHGKDDRRRTLSRVEFAWDQTGEASRWNWVDEEATLLLGDGSEVEGTNRILTAGMRKGGRSYVLNEVNLGTDKLISDLPPRKDSAPVPVYFNVAARPYNFVIEKERKTHLRGQDFDAATYLMHHGMDVLEKYRLLKEHGDAPGVAVNDYRITRDGDLVTLISASPGGVIYHKDVFDLSKGGNMVHYTNAGPGTAEHWDYEWEEHEGVWVPVRVRWTHETDQQNSVHIEREVVFVESVVNRPIPEAAFTLEAMGIQPGDRVHDNVAKISVTYQGEGLENLEAAAGADGSRPDGGPGAVAFGRYAGRYDPRPPAICADRAGRRDARRRKRPRRYCCRASPSFERGRRRVARRLRCGGPRPAVGRGLGGQPRQEEGGTVRHRTFDRDLRAFLSCLCLLTALSAASGQDGLPSFDSRRPQCGHWAILRSCELLGVPIEMPAVMQLLPAEPDGHSFAALSRTLERIGLGAQGRREDLAGLAAGPLPAIAHMHSPDHFVVVDQVLGDRVALYDSEGGRRMVPAADFAVRWSGALLRVSRPVKPVPLPKYLKAPASPAPRIAFETRLLDQGEAAEGAETLTYSFTVRNLGDADLVISGVHPDCACIGSTVPAAPIAPGGEGAVTLDYRVQGGGRFSHRAAVTSNDPVAPVVVLTAAGETRRLMEVVPARLKLGTVARGQTARATAFIRYTGEQPLRIVSAQPSGAGAMVRYRALTRAVADRLKPGMLGPPPANQFLVELEYTPTDEPAGNLAGEVRLKTNLPGYPVISLPFQGAVAETVALRPSLLFFGETEAGREIDRLVRVASQSGEPMEVLGVEQVPAGVTYAVETAEGDAVSAIRFRAGADASAVWGDAARVRVRAVSSGKEIVLPLPVYLRAAAGPDFPPDAGEGRVPDRVAVSRD